MIPARVHHIIIFLAAVLILSGWRARRAQAALELNDVAIDVMQSCIENATIETVPRSFTDVANGVRATWLEGAVAHCRGDEAAARAAWRQLLAASSARLPAVRAAAPQDVTLAQLAAERYPEEAVAFFWLGEAQAAAGQAHEAIAAYERALVLDPADGVAWRMLGDLYQESETAGWQTAARAYDEACFRWDRGKNGCLRAGRLYLEQGRYGLAADRYRRSLQQLRGYTDSQRGLAEALLALGQAEEALPYLRALAEKGDEQAREQLRQLETTAGDGR